ncbi:Sulfatase [Lachnospiraceae bacterium G11]|nr:Sulfatase [Lachnospiraceae bacterium G11]
MGLTGTIYTMFALAVICGAAFFVLQSLLKGEKTIINSILRAVYAAMSVMSGLLALRLILFKGTTILLYKDKPEMIVWDVLIALFILLLCVGESFEEVHYESFFRAFVLVCACIAFFVLFSIEYKAWDNVNVAIWHILLPQNFIWITAIPVVAVKLFSSIRNKKKFADKDGITCTIICTTCLWITYSVCPFLETFLTNRSEFSVAISQIAVSLVAGMVLLLLAPVAIGILLSNRNSRMWFSAGMFALIICGYTQGAFLNGRLFLMDGKELSIERSMIWINVGAWAVILLLTLALLINHKVRKNVGKIIKYGSLFLIAIQVIGLIGIIPQIVGGDGKAQAEYDSNYLSDEGICEIGSQENVVVFVLDTYDKDFLEEVVREEPDFLAPLNGFIRYTDVVSQFSRTFPSIPYMLTHKPYFYDYPESEYVNSAYGECEFWNEIKSCGYNWYLYIIGDENVGQSIKEAASNYSNKATIIREDFSIIGCMEAILHVGGYRLFPTSLKLFENYTAESLEDMIIQERVWDKQRYSENDAGYFRMLKENGLKVSNEPKCFKYIHLKGAHAPYNIDRYGNKVTNRVVNPTEQYIGSMNYVYTYISELKRLGLFEDTLIIVTADHGENFTTEELPEETNPILLIKPLGSTDREPLKENNCRASLEDILAVLSFEMNVNYSDSIGLNILSENEDSTQNRIRFHYYSVVQDGEQIGALKYIIDGDSNDFSNWKKTDEFHRYDYY